jgi:RNA polymerase sigma-70 factor (ECF subfamily)
MPAIPGHYAAGPEALVVSLAANGDRNAFAELVRRRQAWVRQLMRRCCADTRLAEDLAQQVFLQAWRKIPHLKDPIKFDGWLKRLAINEWLQHKRKKDPLRRSVGDDFGSLVHRDKTAVALDLNKALDQLPAPVSLCLVLSYYERMSHIEIATMTRMQLGTVKSHIRRGSEQLRRLLSAYDETAAGETTQ